MSLYQTAQLGFLEKVSPLPVDASRLDQFGVAHIVIRQDDRVITDYIGVLVLYSCENREILKAKCKLYWIDNLDQNMCSPGTMELVKAFKHRAQFCEAFIELGHDTTISPPPNLRP